MKAPLLQYRARTTVTIALLLLFVPLLLSTLASAQELHSEVRGVWRARVIETRELPSREITGGVFAPVQEITAEFLEGPQKGGRVVFENDFTQLREGEAFYLNYLRDISGAELYSVREPDRRGILLTLGLLFAGAVLLLGRMKGARSLVSLALSFSLLIFVLLPLLLAGYPPLLTSIILATLMLGLSMALTHGLTRSTLAAFLGSGCAILFAGLLASLATSLARLSGYTADEAVYLNLATDGALSISGLLLASLLIGVIGVLDDVAITQASAVEEIDAASRGSLSPRELYRRAMNIGREHVGAVVNTLALAYAGASLPLLLLFSLSESPSLFILNEEIFATEIIRTVVGSMGLILATPLATLLAILLRKGSVAHASDS